MAQRHYRGHPKRFLCSGRSGLTTSGRFYGLLASLMSHTKHSQDEHKTLSALCLVCSSVPPVPVDQIASDSANRYYNKEENADTLRESVWFIFGGVFRLRPPWFLLRGLIS